MLASGVTGERRPVATLYGHSSRAAAHVLPGERHLRVLGVRRETERALSLILDRPADFAFRAGQFVTLILTIDGNDVRRSYSLSSDPADRSRLVITVKRIDGGLASSWLHQHAGAGMILRVRGPSGTFTFEPGVTRELVLVGGGSGVTPLMSILRVALEQTADTRVTLVLANTSEHEIIFRDEIARFAATYSSRLRVLHVLETKGAFEGTEGRVSRQILADALSGHALDTARVHVCGPGAMMDSVTADLAALHVPATSVHIERFVSLRPLVTPPGSAPRRLEVMGVKGLISPGKTVLEGAQEAGVNLDYSCTMGGCGACKVRLLSGEVVHDEPNCLTQQERDAGMILTCVARPLSDISLERLSLRSHPMSDNSVFSRPMNEVLEVLPQRARFQTEAYLEAAEIVGEVSNPRVLMTLLPSAARGFVLKRGKQGVPSLMKSSHEAHFDWRYKADMPQMRDLYRRAKQNQWDGEVALDWSTDVDPLNPEVPIVPYEFFQTHRLAEFGIKVAKNDPLDLKFRYDITSWMLSQFLHGEQGALQAAAQVTECVQWMDGKFYGATQVMDEARHMEVFHRYLETKLNKLYDVNDNLYVIIDSLMHDSRWDMKFLGMQLMIEGLALGAFGVLYKLTKEPLLKNLLKNVIQDEARHVHYGVIALREHYQTALSEAEMRERQDWAFEVALLMRNRFMAHEVYEESFQHVMSRKQWNHLVITAPGMSEFRHTMFERLVPNLKYVGLLDARMEKHYRDAGLLVYRDGKNASQLTGDQMLADLDQQGSDFERTQRTDAGNPVRMAAE